MNTKEESQTRKLFEETSTASRSGSFKYSDTFGVRVTEEREEKGLELKDFCEQ